MNTKVTLQELLEYTRKGTDNLNKYRHPNQLHRQFSLIDLEREESPIIIRTYWPYQVCYACCWVSLPDVYTIGKGKASGYGYCKESAAIDYAMSSAGLRFKHEIGGVGLSAVRGALLAAAEYFKIENFFIAEANA